MHQNVSCDLCQKDIPQSDAHLLDCSYLIKMCPELSCDISIEHEDIFGGSVEQLEVVKMYIALFKIKTSLEEENN